MRGRKENEKPSGNLELSGKESLQQFSQLKQSSKLVKMFAAVLIDKEGWRSNICALTWELKDVKYSRYYFYLKASRVLFRTSSAHGPYSADCEITIEEVARKMLLPTPLSSDATTGAIIGRNDVYKMTGGLPRKVNRNGKDGSVGLARLVQLLPTPLARNHIGGRHPETLKRKGRKPSNSLGDTINAIAGACTKLNPLFISEMMGFPVKWTLMPFLKTKLFLP
jgi:hypothetical protein